LAIDNKTECYGKERRRGIRKLKGKECVGTKAFLIGTAEVIEDR
jgi:hypothetical protein